MTAISWVKKSMNTTVSMDEKTAELVDLAHSFFSEDTDRIQRVKFWNTKEKGDIPADFGRKFKSKKK